MVELVKTKADFEAWLRDMDIAIDRFLNALPREVRKSMDFSPQSLDVVESWLLQKYASYQQLLEPPQLQTWDGVGRYIGETYRKQIGGHWNAIVDDPKYVWYRLPQLTGYSRKTTPTCAHTLGTAALDRRTGTYLRTVLENTKQQEAKWR